MSIKNSGVSEYLRSLSEHRLLEGWARFVQSHPWRVIVFTLLVVAATIPGLGLVKFNNDYRIYFSKDNADLMAWENLLDVYTRSDGLVIVVGTKDGKPIFSPEVTPTIAKLTDDLWKMPYVTRVDSITNFQNVRAKGDEISVDDLVPRDQSASQAYLAEAATIASAEPRIKDLILSKDGTATGIYLQMMLPKEDDAISKATARLLDLKWGLEKEHPDLTVQLGGLVMLNGAFDYFARSDMKTIMPAMFAITIVVMILVFRSVMATVSAMLAVMLAVTVTMGLTGYLGIPIGPHSSVSPQIVKTISVATMMYVVISFLGQMRESGNRDEAIRQAVKVNIVPISLSSFTATVGFLSMLTSVIPPFRHIGIMCAMGMVACYLLSLTFLPSLLAVLPERFLHHAGKQAEWAWPGRLGQYITKNYRRILIAMILIPVPALVGFSRLEIDDNFVRLFKHGTWFREAADYVDLKLAGTTTVDFNLQSGESNGITSPDYLNRVETIKAHLEKDPVVTHVTALTDTIKKINQEMNSGDAGYYRIPSDRATAAQYLLFYEMSLPFGLELNSQINIDKSASRLTVTTKSLSTKETIAFVERTNKWLEENQPGMQARAVSVLVMFSYMAKAVALNAYTAAAIAIVLVVAVIMAGLRSVKLSLIAVLSNIIPIMLVLGLWHWAGRTLDFTAGLIFSMTFGVIVDNSLHIMYWYSRGLLTEGMSVAQAVQSAIERRGPAMLFSTLTLVLGFSVFGLSNFFVNVTLGLLTALVFFVALVWDILVTPSLLMLMKPYSERV